MSPPTQHLHEPNPWVPRLVSVLDRGAPTEPSRVDVLDGVSEVRIGRGEITSGCVQGGTMQLRLADGRVSSRHALLKRELDTWVLEDSDSRNGTWVGGQRVRQHRLRPGDLIEVGHRFFLFDVGPRGPAPSFTAGELGTLDALLGARLEALSHAACTDVPLLIYGEPGTDKASIAASVHARSKRAGALVAVDCKALRVSDLEARLLAGWKGHAAYVDQADHGTLFADDVAELSRSGQVALARAIDRRTSTRGRLADFRVIAATAVELPSRVEARRFSPELLGRLRGFELEIPPFRARRCDLGLVLAQVLHRCERTDASFDRAAARLLLSYPWPLNEREVEQTLVAALASTPAGSAIVRQALPMHIRRPFAPAVSA